VYLGNDHSSLKYGDEVNEKFKCISIWLDRVDKVNGEFASG